MKTAVVLLNWNGSRWLKQFMPILLANTPAANTSIIVADNGSEDGSVQMVQEQFPDAGIVQLDKNYGFAGGYNKALKQIDADYYILLNTDIEVTPQWLEALIEPLEEDTGIAAVMPKIKSWNNRERFEYAGAAGGYIDFLGYPFCRGRMLDTLENDLGQYDDAREIFWATGAAMAVRAAVFHEIEGFDADFFAHMEEIDLCWRLKNQGYKIYYQPESTVYHAGGGTLPNESPHKLYLNFRNNLYLLYKNLPERKLDTIMHLRRFLDGLSALMYLLKGEPANFMAVWKAHMSYYNQKRHVKAKRILLEMNRKAKETPHIYPKSIVWQYFIKNNKYFKALDW